MFKNLLIPLDLTDKHQPALQVAAELAQQRGGKVTLLHVIELIQGLGMEEERPFYDRLERVARQHLSRQSATLQGRNVPCQGEIRFGNRPQEIVRHAEEKGVDLIVLTSPRPDPANPAASWGSLSFKVSVLSRCPVLLVK